MGDPELLIVGSGAMACLFAARLAAAGIQPLLLAHWPEGIQALASGGVRHQDDQGQIHTFPVRVITDPQEGAGVRLALVLVKSWQTSRAAEQLVECLHPEGLALTLQNGLGNYEILVRRLGAHRVALGTTTLGAYLLEPGLVQAAGEGVLTLGVHARLKTLTDLLGRARFIVDTAPDLTTLLWGKLVVNAAINPLTAILGCTNGELIERPEALKLMANVARETAAVAVARGVQLPFPDPALAVEAIARSTAQNLSSMLQDVRRGAPTEIDVINGAIVRAAEEKGVAAPINRVLWQLVKALRRQAA